MGWEGELRLRVLSREELSEGVISLVLGREDAVPLAPFLPGQYLTFVLDVPGQERPVIRCYSLSDAPNGRTYRISVKRVPSPKGQDVPPGVASSYINEHVRPGDVLRASAPGGLFTLRPGETGPLVFLAGGIGVTPLLSMVEGLVAEGARRPVQFVLGVRRGREHPFKAHLEWLARKHDWLHLHVAYSQPDPSDREGTDYRSKGRVTPQLLQGILPQASEPYRFYICGPAPMMDVLTSGLETLGVPGSRIHIEAFGKATVKPLTHRLTRRLAKKGLAPIDVSFTRSGQSATWTPESGNLLDFAMSQGVFFPFACAAGHCGTCSNRLLSGAVEYPMPPQFAVREGHCLPCIAVPVESIELDV